MIGRRRPRAPGPDPWEAEGRRLAAQCGGVSAAVVLGTDLDATARVALGAGRSIAAERHVAIADLAGVPRVLGATEGGSNAPGITESFTHGISLNDVARPAAGGPATLFILPRGSEPLTSALLESDRWSRLVAGFAEAGALLLIVAPSGTPGLEALVPRTDGVIAVGNVDVPIAWRVIAQGGETPAAARTAADRRPPHVGRRVVAALTFVVLAAVGAAFYARSSWRVPAGAPVSPGTGQPVRSRATEGSATAVTSINTASAPTGAADTVRVPDPVNPPDSIQAAGFSVELVATNTVAGANLWVRERAGRLPGVTISPVVIGAARLRWYKVIAGAWRERRSADSLLAALRRDDVLESNAGLVVRAPLALMLERDVPRAAATERLAALGARGVRGYALLQEDGSVRLYAGAFETAAAAVPLDADLRAAGFSPQLAYRTGRTF